MSANNMWYAKEVSGKWYGWDCMAERWGDDDHVKLHLVRADAKADSLEELEKKMSNVCGYSEYGMTTQPYLLKDGTPIEVVI